MKETKTLRELQLELTAYVRNPESSAIPEGIERRRLNVYRDLIFNTTQSLISNTFPVLKSLYSLEQWNALIDSFIKRHKSVSPYFLEVAEEFLAYLQNEHTQQIDDKDFQVELAQYEWAELALSVAEPEPQISFDSAGDMLEGIPICSNLAWVLSYNYPVHRISPDYQPGDKELTPTFLVVYRRKNQTIGFLEINAMTASLLLSIQNTDNQQSGRSLLLSLAKQHPNIKEDSILTFGTATLQTLKEKGILLGVKLLSS